MLSQAYAIVGELLENETHLLPTAGSIRSLFGTVVKWEFLQMFDGRAGNAVARHISFYLGRGRWVGDASSSKIFGMKASRGAEGAKGAVRGPHETRGGCQGTVVGGEL